MSQPEKTITLPSPPLRLTLFGQPQITVTLHGNRRPEIHALPGDDWVLLLVYLAYFGERDAQGGSVERSKIESAWRHARAKDPQGTPEYFDYKAAGAVRNATSEMRRYIAGLCEGTDAEGTDIIDVSGKGLLRLNPQIMASDMGDFFDNLRIARRANLPDEASLARECLTAAQNLFEEGEFLPGFEHRFGRYEILENGHGLESWVLDARRSLQTKQNQTAERLVKLAPFLMLPSYENAFVPREDLAVTIREWLFEEGGADGKLPALVLHGGYGAGKTRLAVETVRSLTIKEALGLYSEGIAFLPLDSYFTQPGSATETAFLQAVAQRLRAPDNIQNSLTSHHASEFFRWIGARPKRLLILDNGESLYSDLTAKALTRLLHATDGRLRCLITSRAAWPGLRHLPVEDLPLPSQPNDDFETFAGSRLFLERVRLRDPGYVIPNAASLLTALEQTEGVPLNIEILAGRAWDKGTEGLRALIEQRRLTLLAVQGPDPPTADGSEGSPSAIAARRHLSAAASIFWSIDRLPEAERVKFVRLAVFPYDWSVAAVGAICDATEDDLRAWRDLYLATYDSDRNRWLLRPRIREVAQELFAAVPDAEAEAVREKYRNFYLTLSEKLSVKLKTSEVKISQQSFEREMPNFRASLEIVMGRTNFESGQVALHLSKGLSEYLLMRGRINEAVEMLKFAINHSGATDATPLRIKVLSSLAITISNRVLNPKLAVKFIEELMFYLSDLVKLDRAQVLYTIAVYYTWNQQYEQAHKFLKEAYYIFHKEYDNVGLAQVFNVYGCNEAFRSFTLDGAAYQKCIEEQYKWIVRSRTALEKLNDIPKLVIALSNEGQTACDAGFFAGSFTAIRRGLRLAYDSDLIVQILWFFNVSGNYCFQQQQYNEAVRIWNQGEVYARTMGGGLELRFLERLDICRTALGEVVYQREAEIAKAWTLDQGVDYVLTLPPPPPDLTEYIEVNDGEL